MSIEKLSVDLGARSYDILIGPDLIAQAGDVIAPLAAKGPVAIITEQTVAGHYLAPFQEALKQAGMASVALTLPKGEATKSWPFLEQTVEWLLAQKIERDGLVVALGGGVIGDLAGFAAAIVRRGVRLVQVPTSLLAQVDSSVGGKTGINSVSGKNLVGAFYQPQVVLADTDVLGTLTPRDVRAGYGEVAKYGLLGDATFFEWLEANAHLAIDGDTAARMHIVRRSCEMKAEIVARDEKEAGDRALLNLGHTFGHALETATGYSDRLLHGEAVAIGCGLAFDLSHRLGLCSQEDPVRVRAHFAQLGCKKDLSDIAGDLPDAQTLIALMGQDKKVSDGKIAFILSRGIGDAFVARDVDMNIVRGVIADALSMRR